MKAHTQKHAAVHASISWLPVRVELVVGPLDYVYCERCVG